MNNYDDIINLPHHISKTRPRMSIEKRAGQFAPFSALTGYDDQIRETARLTDRKIELDEGRKKIINLKLNFINQNINKENVISVMYFKKDIAKTGGEYLTHRGIVKRIYDLEKKIAFKDNFEIYFDDILEITSETLKFNI